MRHLAEGVRSSGCDILGALDPSPLYNDNAACIQWSHNMTSKKIRHMELRKNFVREWVENKTLNVFHVSGRVNPTDIFTKEMQDGAHFRRLQDSFMCRLSDFLQQSLLVIHHSRPHTQLIVRWYLEPRLHMQFLHKILISKLCVPFPYVEPSQLFPTCRALAISS